MENNSNLTEFGDNVTDATKKIARENALKFGLYLGLFNVVVQLIIYFIDPLIIYTNQAIGLVLMVISISASVYFCIELKKMVGGFWNFRLAFSSIFIMFLISSLVALLYQVVEFHLIDKELPQKSVDAIMNKMHNDLSAKGLSEDQIKSQMEITKKFVPLPGSIMSLTWGLFASIVVSIILALIFAAIFKKDPPVFGGSNAS